MAEVTSGIADLIAKIKRDGVDAGQSEREQILAGARDEATALVKKAQEEAEAIKRQAKLEAADAKARLQSELTLAARDFVYKFQQQVVAQAIRPAAGAATQEALSDTQLVARLLEGAVASLSGDARLEATVHADQRAALEAALAGRITAETLVLKDGGGDYGFKLQREGDHFVWDFGVEAVARELARLVEPGLRDALSFKNLPSTED